MQGDLFSISHDDVIDSLVKRGALFVVSHSGGKDSQAMLLKLKSLVPYEQLLVVHATLGRFEWPGTLEHIRSTIGNIPLIITEAANKDFFGMVRQRGMWPSPKYRQCTSDLKRGPIERAIRHFVKHNPHYNGLVVNCMGMRAQESAQRSKLNTFKRSKTNSVAGREWYDWLPIHSELIDDVFNTIYEAGQKPHWAYEKGMTRLSCRFCIMASAADLKTSALLNPDLYREYCELEREIDHTFLMPTKGRGRLFLPDLTGITA